jgi:hypothetical protein
MAMLGSLIWHQTEYIRRQKIGGNAFQIFGIDILIDKDLKCWVLEVNDHPS